MPQEIANKNLIFVDCEGHGRGPTLNDSVLFEFDAVATDASSWKKLRVTAHDHNPVHDAMGNLEAFEKLLNGER